MLSLRYVAFTICYLIRLFNFLLRVAIGTTVSLWCTRRCWSIRSPFQQASSSCASWKDTLQSTIQYVTNRKSQDHVSFAVQPLWLSQRSDHRRVCSFSWTSGWRTRRALQSLCTAWRSTQRSSSSSSPLLLFSQGRWGTLVRRSVRRLWTRYRRTNTDSPYGKTRRKLGNAAKRDCWRFSSSWSLRTLRRIYQSCWRVSFTTRAFWTVSARSITWLWSACARRCTNHLRCAIPWSPWSWREITGGNSTTPWSIGDLLVPR